MSDKLHFIKVDINIPMHKNKSIDFDMQIVENKINELSGILNLFDLKMHELNNLGVDVNIEIIEGGVHE